MSVKAQIGRQRYSKQTVRMQPLAADNPSTLSCKKRSAGPTARKSQSEASSEGSFWLWDWDPYGFGLQVASLVSLARGAHREGDKDADAFSMKIPRPSTNFSGRPNYGVVSSDFGIPVQTECAPLLTKSTIQPSIRPGALPSTPNRFFGTVVRME